MDSNKEQLLEKYWAAETSLEEEAQLREWVKKENEDQVTEDLRALFDHFEREKKVVLGDDFDRQLLDEIGKSQETKVVKFSDYFRRYSGIAAAMLVLMVSSYVFMRQQSAYEQVDTFDSPEVAYAALKEQLLMVSVYMNKGNSGINELSNLGKADNGLQGLSKMGKASLSFKPLSKMSFR